MMTIGVLALQGAFVEHVRMLETLGVGAREIRQKADFSDDLRGIVLPGGESTVIGKLLHKLDLFEPIRTALDGGMPVLGTCAGLILLANRIADDATVHLGTMDITVRRNAFGRQLGSFSCVSPFKGIGDMSMVFIRAPVIEAVGKEVEILAQIGGRIVAARQGRKLVTAFHPELTGDARVHESFLALL